ncbi:MAG TPA: M23 family metallopeptidase, partial [Anaerolineae bacterium]|nr:M23 family metallopeptidase [Anaerolineae bacterium]
IWIIGNEMNHPVERPGVQIDWSRSAYEAYESSRGRMVPWRFSALDSETRSSRMAVVNPGEVITPQLYARCYRLCRDAIKRVPGHADDQVLVGATAPWNNLTKYEGNPTGDWVQYHADILKLLGAQNCDGVTVHTYTHSPDPAQIYTDTYMGPPFQNRQYNFRAYRDFMNAVPASMRHLPAYITETDQDVAWLNQNNGWVQRAYGEIDYWNKQPGNQQIRALALYRWPQLDRWVIDGKQGVIDGWREAMRNDYRWSETPTLPPPPKPPAFTVGQTIYVVSEANLRRSPGYTGKPQGDVVITLPVATACTVLAGPQTADGLDWWQVRCTVDGQERVGWVAQTTPSGATLLSTRKPPTPVEPKPVEPTPPKPVLPTPPTPSAPFKVGDKVWNTEILNLRRSAGFQSKPANDIIYEIPAGSQLTITGGPQAVDGLTWWGVRFASQFGNRYDGWVAGAKASGASLLASTPPAPVEPPTPPTPVVPPTPPPTSSPVTVGAKAVAQAALNLRRTPGAFNKPANDVIYDVPAQGEVTVLEGPEQVEGAPWWRVRYVSRFGNPFLGWVAEKTPQGTALLTGPQTPAPTPPTPTPSPTPAPPPAPTPSPTPPAPTPTPPPSPALSQGMKATTNAIVNLRRSPGFKDKPANDILYEMPAGSEVMILDGPRAVDDLTWWNIRFTSQFGNRFDGWVAATKASGEPLLNPGTAPTPVEPPKPVTPPPTGKFQPGQRVYAASFLNLRRSAGYVNKTADDVLVEAPLGAAMTILAGPQRADDLTWWQVRYVDGAGRTFDGWAAEASSKGVDYLVTSQPAPPIPTGPLPTKTFVTGNVVVNAYTDPLNVRRSPGYTGKDNNSDIVAKLPRNSPVVITEGPRQVDSLQWWRIAGAADGAGVDGWVAEIGPKGQRFLIPAQLMGKINLGKPFEGNWRVTQLMADRPEVYKQFSYDGVPLRGHNGVDFGTPNGTKLLATDDGEVVQVGYEAKGFGNFAKLKHE